jgi:signal transduction histidine kinase
VQTVARGTIVLVTLLSLALFVVDLRGMKLQAVGGLVVLGSATMLATSRRYLLRRGAQAALGLVGVYGLVSLIGLFDVDLGFRGIPANTAVLFACLGFGIAGGLHRSQNVRWFADGLVIAGSVVALFAQIAVLFGSRAQYPIASHDPMAIATAVLGFLLAGAVILQRSDRGLGKLFNSNTSGGVLARRLVPLLLVLPIGIARIAYLGVEEGVYDAAFATSIGVTLGVAILTIAIVASARVVDRIDTVRRGNEAQIRQMVGDIARQSKELQRTNEELESFSYSVSHDLRAPIRHIAGFSELLTKIGADKLDAKAKHYVAMIVESAAQAGQLIDDLLEFSRMGRTPLSTRELSVADVVRDVWAKLRPERADRQIELRLGELTTVTADPAMLEVAIGNLLSNAVKYTAREPKAVIDLESRITDDDVVISIRDNGVGFDMKYVDKLFGVFQRLHGDEFEGVGIGLANVKRVVERHGGRVWAEGEVDRGASFHISLPRTKDVSA